MWKAIPSCPGYEAHISGNIRSIDRITMRSNGRQYTHTGQLIKGYTDSHGYLQFRPYQSKTRKSCRVHRAVWEAYMGETELELDHINGDKMDNRLENLQAVTRKQHSKLTNDRLYKEAYDAGYAQALKDMEK